MTDVINRLILEAEVGDAEKKLAAVRKEQDRLSDSVELSKRIYGATSKEYQSLLDDLKQNLNAERALENQILETNDAYGERRKALDAQAKFDRTSQGVALAGDIESNLRTIGGTVGALGGSGGQQIEKALAGGSEIFATIEALPRLKEAAAGLPAVLSQASDSLGTSVFKMGALGLAAAALFAVWEYGKSVAQETTEATKRMLDAREQSIAAEGQSTDSIISSLQDVSEQYRISSTALDENKNTLAAFEQGLNDVSPALRAAAEAGNALGVSGTQLGVLRDSISDLDAKTQEAAASQQVYIDELTNRGYSEEQIADIIANSSERAQQARQDEQDAIEKQIEAEKQLAVERRSAAYEAANFAGQQAKLAEQSKDFTSEQLASQLKAAQQNKIAKEAELKALQSANDGTEEFAKKIAQAQTQLSEINDTIDLLTSSSSKSYAATNDKKKAEEEEAKAAEKAAEKALKAGKAVDGFANSASLAASSLAKSASTMTQAEKYIAQGKNADGSYSVGFSLTGFTKKKSSSKPSSSTSSTSAANDQQKAYDDYLQKQRDFYNDQQKELLDYQRSVEDIRRDAQDKQKDAAMKRDFAAYGQSIRDEDRAIRDQKIQTERRLEDLQNSQMQELAIYKSGQSAILNQTQQFVNKMSGQFNNLFNNIQQKSLEYMLS